MNTLRKLLGDIHMTWKKVIIFAVVAGVYTGGVNLIPVLKDTSFQDIAVTLEWWILFGIIIAVNCEKPWEAGLKVFAFFLISQPLVYIIEMPFLGISVWQYYKYWGGVTILTLPGGMIANFVRKKNLIGTLILSVALALLAISAASYGEKVYTSFPNHILTVIFCLAQIIVLVLCLIPRKAYRGIALAIAGIGLVGSLYIDVMSINNIDVPLPEGKGWSCEFEQEDKSTLSNDDYSMTLSYCKAFVKENTILCKDETGKIVKYKVVIDDAGIVNLVEDKNES